MTSLRAGRLVIVSVTFASLVVLVPAPAGATGIMVARFGGELGNPMADNPTALYYNPAGIAFSHGTNLYVEGLFALRSLSFDRDVGAINRPNQTPGTPDAEGISANSGKNSLLNFIPSPFIGITTDFGVPNLAVGASLEVPFGGTASWDKNNSFANSKYPGAIDGSQRWWDIAGTIESIYFTIGGAYKLPGNVSIGVAANIISSKTDDLRAANADGSDNLVGANGVILEGRAHIDTSATSFSIGAGIAWEPIPELRLGFSYQSQPNFGTITETGTLDKKLGQTGLTHNDVEHIYSLPDVYRLGASYNVSRQVQLRLWGSFERWSVFTSECIVDKTIATRSCTFDARGVPTQQGNGVINNIPRYWQDAIALRASGSYYLNPSVELQLGLGYDGDAVPDKTLELSLPDDTKINATAGAIFRNAFVNRLNIHVGYSVFIGIERTIPVTPSPFDFPTRVPDSAGTYSEFIGLLDVGVGYTF